MRFVCKSSESRASNVQPASRKPARKVISPSDTFRKKARPRRLFCDDRYVRNARNMCPLEVSLFLLHHRTFYDTAAAAAAVTIYRYFGIDNSLYMPFFFAATAQTIFQRNEFRRSLPSEEFEAITR